MGQTEKLLSTDSQMEHTDVEGQLSIISSSTDCGIHNRITHKGEATPLVQVPGWGRCSVFLPMVCAPPRGGPMEKKAKVVNGLFFRGQENSLVSYPPEGGHMYCHPPTLSLTHVFILLWMLITLLCWYWSPDRRFSNKFIF